MLADYIRGPQLSSDRKGNITGSVELTENIEDRAEVAIQVIGRWLARREADRQHELQQTIHEKAGRLIPCAAVSPENMPCMRYSHGGEVEHLWHRTT